MNGPLEIRAVETSKNGTGEKRGTSERNERMA